MPKRSNIFFVLASFFLSVPFFLSAPSPRHNLENLNIVLCQIKRAHQATRKKRREVKELQKFASGEEFIISDAIITQSVEWEADKTGQFESESVLEFFYMIVCTILFFILFLYSADINRAETLLLSINICSRCSVWCYFAF